MSASRMRVWLSSVIVLALFLISASGYAQVTIGTIDPGPYTPGSTIAAPFTINPVTCIGQANVFTLQLSDASGSFAAPTNIGTYNGFYSTYVNGELPATLPTGANYKLRVMLSNGTFSTESTPFSVIAGAAVAATITSNPINPAEPETFGTCVTRPNNTVYLTNNSTSGSIVTATVTDELYGGTPATIAFTTSIQPFIAQQAHYTVMAKAVGPGGTVATRAYLIINNETYTAFATSSNNIVCLPLGTLEYIVDVNLLKKNFPGNRYFINWGDGVTTSYSLCEIEANGGKVSHLYTQSSCGLRAGSINNAYTVMITSSNAFCGNVGTPISSSAKVVVQPENRFTGPQQACVNRDVTFVNTSILGEDPNTNLPECTPNVVYYNWLVDGVPVEVNRPRGYNFTYRFTDNGVHRVTLTSVSQGACSAVPFDFDICVQKLPEPSFTLPANKGCGPFDIQPVNTSVTDNACNPTVTYNWRVSPSTGVSFATGNATSFQPTFRFTQPGVYSIILDITTPNCGLVSTNAQQVTVNNVRDVTLSPNTTLCNLGTYDFSRTTTGRTQVTYSGTETVLDDVFEWTVTGGAFSFENGTTAASKYPSIKFNDYTTYTITAKVTNICAVRSSTQTITFVPAPTVDAGPDQAICYNATATLSGSINDPTNAIQTLRWVGGSGTFSPNNTTLNAVYTPSAGEVTAGLAVLTLRATTNLGGVCATIENEVRITIYPRNNITSAATKEICSGASVSYTPTSSVSGSTFTWTAVNADGRASGFTASGSGTIADVITNSDNTLATTVVYTIRATANGCDGPPLMLTVTVNPVPVLTATPAATTLCSNSSAGITLSSTAAGTRYIWTSVASAGILGNTNQATPSATVAITDQLKNNATTQGTVTYTITPVVSGCPALPVQVVINVDPPVTTSVAGTNQSVCNATSYVLSANTPNVGTGTWSLTSGQTGVTFDNVNSPNATASGLVNGQTYTFRWTIAGTGTCPASVSSVNITINPPTVGGSVAGSANVCSGSNSGSVTLSGQVGNVLRWEKSEDNGVNWIPVSPANTTTTKTYSGLTTTTQYRAVVQNANCNTEFSLPATITVSGRGTSADAGSPQVLCNATTVTLDGINPAPGETGTWTQVSGPAATINNINDPKTTVAIVPGTYLFRWTIASSSPCGPTNATVTITNRPPLTNTISTTSSNVCSGQTITITGTAPTGGNGIYTYLWETSTDGITWSAANLQTGQSLNYTLTTTLSFRRTVFSGPCSLVSNVINIIAQPPLGNNTIGSSQDICGGQTSAPLTGSIPTGGDGSYIYQWQSSTNGTTWSNINGEVNQNYAPGILTTTTFYRRIVSSLACNGPLQNISAAVKLTLLPNARAQYNFTTDANCAPFVIRATNIVAVPYPDRNSTYTWFAGATQIGTGITFPGYTITSAGATVNIRLVATSSLGCSSDEFSHDFTTNAGFTTGFTQDATTGCGPLTVHFTNTSSSLTGATFKWDFGNGVTSSLASPPDVQFLPDPTGDDITYTVTLTASTPCGDQVKTSTVLISSAPVGAFSPDKTTGCSPLNVNFSNTSRGNGMTFTYDFGDGSPLLTTTSNANVSHTYNVTAVTDFVVTMTATNLCGTDVNTHVIRVSPNNITAELVVAGNQLSGCAPFTVSFRNNTRGASSFIYDFGDGAIVQTSSAPETIQHTFTRGGTFTVTLTGMNNCSTASTTETITVLDQPAVGFSADRVEGCAGLAVRFTNSSAGAVSYLWDFGDGQTSNEVSPLHVYSTAGATYSVTLTATNSLGCTNTLTMNNYINIVAPPVSLFTVQPGNQISVPNYRFAFTDVSTGSPVSWTWDFGDGNTSRLQHPVHTFARIGTYTVRLTTVNKEGCSATSSQVVTIVDVPGNLIVPNAFMPGSQNNEVRLFKAKGRGIEAYKISVFNKWGQVLWESTALSNGEPEEGWDGTYKGQQQPQGTYFWKMEVKFINGSEWKGVTYGSGTPKRTGEIYLIR